MKNNNLFILMAAVFALISCGTANRSAYYNGSQLRNSIYYAPDNSAQQEYVQQQQYLQNLQERTAEAMDKSDGNFVSNTATKTIYVGENNEVTIPYSPGTTYSIVDDPESYEARLRKFDSPVYTINIDFDLCDSYPWYDWRYNWRYDWRYNWYYGWNSPWYSSWYWWHTPGWNWSWMYDPWWGHAYWPGYWPVHRPVWHPGHHGAPGYHPGGGPGAKPGHGRDVYYGKRNSSPTYTGNRNNPAGGNHGIAGKPNTGSVTRRPSMATQIKGQGTRNPQMTVQENNGDKRAPGNSMQQNGNNSYRRVAPKKNGTSYTKGNSQQHNSYNSGNRSSYSSGNSNRSYGNANAGAARNSNGNSGSSYRRR